MLLHIVCAATLLMAKTPPPYAKAHVGNGPVAISGATTVSVSVPYTNMTLSGSTSNYFENSQNIYRASSDVTNLYSEFKGTPNIIITNTSHTESITIDVYCPIRAFGSVYGGTDSTWANSLIEYRFGGSLQAQAADACGGSTGKLSYDTASDEALIYTIMNLPADGQDTKGGYCEGKSNLEG